MLTAGDLMAERLLGRYVFVVRHAAGGGEALRLREGDAKSVTLARPSGSIRTFCGFTSR